MIPSPPWSASKLPAITAAWELNAPDRIMSCASRVMATQRGHSIENVAARLLEVSEKAQENARRHDEGYASVAARNAADAAERGRKRGSGR